MLSVRPRELRINNSVSDYLASKSRRLISFSAGPRCEASALEATDYHPAAMLAVSYTVLDSYEVAFSSALCINRYSVWLAVFGFQPLRNFSTIVDIGERVLREEKQMRDMKERLLAIEDQLKEFDSVQEDDSQVGNL